jgi:hypothetical protein
MADEKTMIQIDQEHPDYRRLAPTWAIYRDLYAGGQQFKTRAVNYLTRRQKEPLDVFAERVSRAFYQNYIGSIVDWYSSTLFHREPSLQYDGGSESGRKFLSEVQDNCDRRGTTLATFFQEAFRNALVVGRTHILIDFPRATSVPSNRAEEEASGLSRAFLIAYQAEELINWSKDDTGCYEWVVIRTKVDKQPDVNFPGRVMETIWRYYDRTSYKLFRRVEGGEQNGAIEFLGDGSHALSNQNRVPILDLEANDSYWLMNKAAQLQLEHFNKSNALGWAITMGLFAMPVIYSDRAWNQIVGESYFIQLAPGDRFGWAEPDGKVHQIAAAHLETLKEEIYRVCYLSQVSGEDAGGRVQSALSKQLDFQVTQEVLRAYGVWVKSAMRKVLEAIVAARQDDVQITITGMDELDISDFASELQQATNLLALGIQSATFKQQVFERLALKYLSDVRQETKDQIVAEISAQIKS